MEDDTLAHAQEIDPLLTIIFAIIKPLDGEAIAERLDGIVERDAMGVPIGPGLGVVSFEFLVAHMY
jgi:hypothetical protein